jgi:Sigma-70, region 4
VPEATFPEFSLDDLLAKCSSLKPIHRVCVILRFAQVMSHSEIAAQTGLTELQVKGNLQYALQLLRNTLSDRRPLPPQRSYLLMPDHPRQSHDEIEETLPRKLRSISNCPPLALLRAYQEQVLPSTLVSEIADHLQHCGLCPMLLDDLEQVPQPPLTANERERIRHTIPSPTGTSSKQWYVGFATAAAPILAAVLLVLHHSTHKPDQTAHIASPVQPKPTPLRNQPISK